MSTGSNEIFIKNVSGRTTMVWVYRPPPLDLSGSYFFHKFFPLMTKSGFLLRKDTHKKVFFLVVGPLRFYPLLHQWLSGQYHFF